MIYFLGFLGFWFTSGIVSTVSIIWIIKRWQKSANRKFDFPSGHWALFFSFMSGPFLLYELIFKYEDSLDRILAHLVFLDMLTAEEAAAIYTQEIS